jgi:hypothetical protein
MDRNYKEATMTEEAWINGQRNGCCFAEAWKQAAVDEALEEAAKMIDFHRNCIMNPSYLNKESFPSDQQASGQISACVKIAAGIRAMKSKGAV